MRLIIIIILLWVIAANTCHGQPGILTYERKTLFGKQKVVELPAYRVTSHVAYTKYTDTVTGKVTEVATFVGGDIYYKALERKPRFERLPEAQYVWKRFDKCVDYEFKPIINTHNE